MRLPAAPRIVLDEVDSTQSEAARRLAQGEQFACILARNQTQGRGRFQRVWHSEPGASLAMSLAFPDYAGHPRPWLVGMAVAVAAAAAVHARLRWPNDLMLDGRKLGGVLSEMLPDASGRKMPVVGVGVNLSIRTFPPELADTATSLALHRPGEYDASAISDQIVERIERLPEPEAWADLRPAWMLFDQTPGRAYRLPNGSEGVALGIGPEGELLVSVEGETRSVVAADAMP